MPEGAWDVQYPMRQGKGDPYCLFLVTLREKKG
jgi:hypothetical protein